MYERDDLTRSGRILRPGQLNALRMHTAVGCFQRSSAELCSSRKHTYLPANYMGRRNFGVRLDLSTPSGPWTNFMSPEFHFLARKFYALCCAVVFLVAFGGSKVFKIKFLDAGVFTSEARYKNQLLNYEIILSAVINAADGKGTG